jgi:hypothetical protein
VINGVARIVEKDSNMWASDPKKALPQWIELAFPQPARINTVSLTFDTDLNFQYHEQSMVPQCVKDYRLEYHDGREWRELITVSNNFQRRRVHRFDAVNVGKLRLTVTATGGDASARVFQIRAYNE